jgi:serine protease Do
MKKKIVRMIILGFIFGIVACFTFVVLNPVVAGILGQDKQDVTIPEDEVEEEQREDDVIDRSAEQRAEEQRQMRLLKELQNKAKENTSVIVSISGQKKIEKNTELKKTSGVILADNGSEILILSQTLSDKELKNIRITFADGKEYAAKVKMKDNNIGIVICAVEKEELKNDTLKQMKMVTLGNSRISESGDPIFLIGKTGGQKLQISYGFVASSEEKMEISDGSVGLLRVDVAGATYDNGVLFNQNGEMTGLVKKSLSDNKTLVTVLSISDIKNELERMSNGKGVPYIGISGVALPEELKEEGLEEGVWVKEINTESPSMAAGIQPGDVIIKVGDTKISNMNEYRNALLNCSVKEVITVTGLRKGADDSFVEMKFEVVVGKK